MTRTRLGKTVGSIKTDPAGWTYWPERNRDGDVVYVVVAPSGARMESHYNEKDARQSAEWHNEDWFS